MAAVLPPDSPPAAAKWTEQTVRSTWRWTDALLSFRTSRDAAFRFTAGHYARLGLAADDGTLLWRPFSMVSAESDEQLEFVATLVPGGAFSTLLDRIRPGDAMLVDKSSFGFLTVDRVAPGRDLWMLASGTGVGPFVSMLRSEQAWAAFDTLVLVHSVRRGADLAYRAELEALAGAQPPDASGARRARLRYVPVVTREAAPGALDARIPQLIGSGRLQQAVGLPLDPEPSRILVCGNPEMGAELRRLLTEQGFRTPRRGAPGQLAFENYW